MVCICNKCTSVTNLSISIPLHKLLSLGEKISKECKSLKKLPKQMRRNK